RCGTSSPAPGRISPPAPVPWYCPRPEPGERLLDELVLAPPGAAPPPSRPPAHATPPGHAEPTPAAGVPGRLCSSLPGPFSSPRPADQPHAHHYQDEDRCHYRDQW